MRVGWYEDESLRGRQEREIVLGHSMTSAEHALAREACVLARTFERAGLAFDPVTFIATRIVEGSDDERIDPVECLELLVEFGFVERSVALTHEMLRNAA
jgi:hypothetical protein